MLAVTEDLAWYLAWFVLLSSTNITVLLQMLFIKSKLIKCNFISLVTKERHLNIGNELGHRENLGIAALSLILFLLFRG